MLRHLIKPCFGSTLRRMGLTPVGQAKKSLIDVIFGKKKPKVKKGSQDTICVKIYRYNPESNEGPYMQDYEVELSEVHGVLTLDLLFYIKTEIDSTLTFRRSCREGICGSCSMNINGVNRLACIHPIPPGPVVIYPLPHAYVIRDLIVDMNQFYRHYSEIMPYLRRNKEETPGLRSYHQTIEDRAKIDGSYECILCSCCSFACPAYWWHGDEENYFLGPAALLHAYRWVIDSRDEKHCDRLNRLRNMYRMYRCHTIYSCSSCCPKGLNPGEKIAKLKTFMVELEEKDDPGDKVYASESKAAVTGFYPNLEPPKQTQTKKK